MKCVIVAVAAALISAPALGVPVLYGFDAQVDFNGPSVLGRFTIDPALDLDPRPDFGRYDGTGLALTLSDVGALPIVDSFSVFTVNDQFGPFCGSIADGTGQQRRDFISVVSIGNRIGEHVFAGLDVCNSDALTSGSLLDAQLHLFGPHHGTAEGLVLAGQDLLPHLDFPQLLGTSTRIYQLPPQAVPEPSSLLLLAAAGVLVVVARSRA